MIGKKLLSWIGAGLLSAAVAIPAIGATVAHKKVVKHHAAAHHVAHRTHTAAHRKATQVVAHKKLAAKGKTAAKKTVVAAHAVHRTHVTNLTHVTHKKAAVHKTQAVRASYGVTSMHSGKTNVAKAAPAATEKKTVTLAKSSTVKPKTASHGTLLSSSTTVKTQK